MKGNNAEDYIGPIQIYNRSRSITGHCWRLNRHCISCWGWGLTVTFPRHRKTQEIDTVDICRYSVYSGYSHTFLGSPNDSMLHNWPLSTGRFTSNSSLGTTELIRSKAGDWKSMAWWSRKMKLSSKVLECVEISSSSITTNYIITTDCYIFFIHNYQLLSYKSL